MTPPDGVRALIADDEPLLVQGLRRMLAAAWPELQIVATARSGREAVDVFEQLHPDVCFLDVHMPGLSGVEAARYIGARAQLVFVTAFDRYAVEAFEHSAVDYLVKPVEPARLAMTVTRLKARLQTPPPPSDLQGLMARLDRHLSRGAAPRAARWLRVSVGAQLKLIGSDEIDYLRSEDKYTLVAWHDERGDLHQGVIRTPLKELLPTLDPDLFAQVHRAVIVNLRAVAHVVREDQGTGTLKLKGRDELLPVSRSCMHLFRQM